MAFKFLSGFLDVDPQNLNDGQATIDFNPHAVSDDATGSGQVEAGDGAGRDYNAVPAATVSVTATASWADGASYSIRIAGLTREQMQVSWDSEIVEIVRLSYIVVGTTR